MEIGACWLRGTGMRNEAVMTPELSISGEDSLLIAGSGTLSCPGGPISLHPTSSSPTPSLLSVESRILPNPSSPLLLLLLLTPLLSLLRNHRVFSWGRSSYSRDKLFSLRRHQPLSSPPPPSLPFSPRRPRPSSSSSPLRLLLTKRRAKSI